MIWVIANKIEEDGSFPTYRHYKEVFPKDSIAIHCSVQNDDFTFLNKDDVVLIRTRDRNINECVRKEQLKKLFRSTLETELVDKYTHDKEYVKPLLKTIGILYPRTVNIEDIIEGEKYFVKPRYGENSIGVDKYSLCTTKQQIASKCEMLRKSNIEPIIEQYIEGQDATTTIIREGECVKTYSSIMNSKSKEGYHTDTTKSGYLFETQRYESKELEAIAKKIWEAIGAKHYLRIDTRIVNGKHYVLDINMIAGLAPNGYASKCLECNGVNYENFIKKVVNSAT